jgi:hypothetical protein
MKMDKNQRNFMINRSNLPIQIKKDKKVSLLLSLNIFQTLQLNLSVKSWLKMSQTVLQDGKPLTEVFLDQHLQ